MSKQTIEAVQAVLAMQTNSVEVASLANNITNGEKIDTTIDVADIVAGLASVIGKGLPTPVGLGLSIVGFTKDLADIAEELDKNGTIPTAEVYSALSNLSTLVGSVALGAAAVAVGATAGAIPLVIGVGALSILSGATLTLLAMSSDSSIDLNPILDAFAEFRQDVFDSKIIGVRLILN